MPGENQSKSRSQDGGGDSHPNWLAKRWERPVTSLNHRKSVALRLMQSPHRGCSPCAPASLLWLCLDGRLIRLR
jgi:hypothetical protein